MATNSHDFTSLVEWTGNRGQGTQTYRGYDRTWSIRTPGKPEVHCSNDPLLETCYSVQYQLAICCGFYIWQVRQKLLSQRTRIHQ